MRHEKSLKRMRPLPKHRYVERKEYHGENKLKYAAQVRYEKLWNRAMSAPLGSEEARLAREELMKLPSC